MKKILRSRVSTALIATALILGTGAAIAVAVSNDLLGYTWSDTIGWLDMSASSSPSYAVTLNNDGTLTGYAWSDNVGWVQFGGLSGFPTGAGTVAANAQVNTATGAVTGWAQVISGQSAVAPSNTLSYNCQINTLGCSEALFSTTTDGGFTIKYSTTTSVTSTGTSSSWLDMGVNGIGYSGFSSADLSHIEMSNQISSNGGYTWTPTIVTTTGQHSWTITSNSSTVANKLNLAAVDMIMWQSGSGQTVCGTTQDYFYTSTDGGTTWTKQTGAGSRIWSKASLSSDGSHIVATAYSLIGCTLIGGVMSSTADPNVHVSADGGATWSIFAAPDTAGGRAVFFSPDGTKLFYYSNANPNGKLYTSTNMGQTWTTGVAQPYFWAEQIYPLSADGSRLVAVVTSDVYLSTNSGTTWKKITSAPFLQVNQIIPGTDGQHITIFGTYKPIPQIASTDSVIYTTANAGTNWNFIKAPYVTLGILASSDGGKIIAAASPSGVPAYSFYAYPANNPASTDTGWDGWISLSGTLNPSPNFAGTGGVTYSSSTGSFTGYAWGSDVIGWINFNLLSTVNAPVLTPTCALNASSNNLSSQGQSIVLSWNSTNATSCNLKNNIGTLYSTATSSPGLSIIPVGSMNFILQCANGAQICQANQNVLVNGINLGGSGTKRLWLNNDPLKLLTNTTIRSNRNAIINWDVADIAGLGYSACVENVASSNWNSSVWTQGKTLPSLQALNGTAQAQTLPNLPVGSHTLSVICTDPTGVLSPVSTSTNTVKITVLPATINEQ